MGDNINQLLMLELKNLRFQTIIGAYPWERIVRQPIEIDLLLTPSQQHAALNDNLNDAIDYVSIHRHINDILLTHSFQLIEALTSHLVESLWQHFQLDSIKLTLRKPLALNKNNSVAVIIERQNHK